MRRFWKRNDFELGERLRAARSEPRDELVSRISGLLRGSSTGRRWRAGQLGLAAALTAALLAALAAVGGLSYAASSVKHAATVATHVTSSHTTKKGDDEKGDKGKKDDDDKGDKGKGGDDEHGSGDDEYKHCDGDNDGDDHGCPPPKPPPHHHHHHHHKKHHEEHHHKKHHEEHHHHH